jgi:hypothetical protein
MIPYKPNQLDEGLWRKQRRTRLHSAPRMRWQGDGKIRPVPGQGEQETILAAQEHPGFFLAPEDPADASPLPTGRALLGQDRGTCSLKCNIRCNLFWG